MGLKFEEYIKVDLECSRKIEGFLNSWKNHIQRETRARTMEVVTGPGRVHSRVDVAGQPPLIGITSLKMKQSLDAMAGRSGMSMEKAMKLFDHGFTSIEALRAATTDDISVIEGLPS